MTIQERIEQLERRRKWVFEHLRDADLLDEDTYDRCFRIRDYVVAQIDALKWVQAERNREFKDLSDFLKETRGWETKSLALKKPEGMTDEDIIERFKNSGKIYYKPLTPNECFDGNKVEYPLEDEMGQYHEGSRWIDDRTGKEYKFDWNRFKPTDNTTGMED
jgi:hypothetical protein